MKDTSMIRMNKTSHIFVGNRNEPMDLESSMFTIVISVIVVNVLSGYKIC